MSAPDPRLERRYRRCLAFYPRAFRAEHEEEMLGLLMHTADPRQTRPRIGDAMNLITHGLRQRAIAARLPSRWEREHARVMFPVRIAIAIWLCFISTVLVTRHVGRGWLWLIVPAILLHLYIAVRIRPGAAAPPR